MKGTLVFNVYVDWTVVNLVGTGVLQTEIYLYFCVV